jgi:hypothetical protein
MTLPANVRVNIGAPFPATVKGGGVIGVLKQNGIWTITLNFGGLAQFPTIADPTNSFVLIWNALTGLFTLVPPSAVFSSKVTKTLTAPGPYVALPTDEVLIVKQLVGAPFAITVDWSSRTKGLRVVDGKGDASINNITITPAAGQTQLASLNYVYVIDRNGASMTLTPLPDNTGAY